MTDVAVMEARIRELERELHVLQGTRHHDVTFGIDKWAKCETCHLKFDADMWGRSMAQRMIAVHSILPWHPAAVLAEICGWDVRVTK